MKSFKVCAYAICLNEEKFIDKWYDSVKEADIIIVGDTGSTDNTITKLRQKGVIVHELNLDTFRFDVARNKLLDLIPLDVDICVSSDMDEVISQGWRKALCDKWDNSTTRATCKYIWSHNPDGSDGLVYIYERIHSRLNYTWKYPTHEVVEFIGKGVEKTVFVDDMEYHHYPDKTKSRSFNLPLLKKAVQEEPQSTRNMHYLGREYMFMEDWTNCISTLNAYLTMPNATWLEERAASMRYISRAYIGLKDNLSAKKWLYKAIAEQPEVREPYIEMARLAMVEKDWTSVFYYSNQALKITGRNIGFTSEAFAWDYTLYDLLAISSYWLGFREFAIANSNIAISKSPNNERLLDNHKIYTEEDNYPPAIYK